eukprot:TRINITY_DN13014_c0_g1_i1.p1 TRINITY_DN13014_c0_g1~~TRINITY_DN13014_c0_g1_i1.p1  ORF type:complete len:413 (+),score=96.37 TRINITY_DN13014_c0_g1_i1:43-1281(+)
MRTLLWTSPRGSTLLANRPPHTSICTMSIAKKFQELTGSPLPTLLRRNLELNQAGVQALVDAVEAKRPFYLYTCFIPSLRFKELHLGQIAHFQLLKTLQDILQVPILINIADEALTLSSAEVTAKTVDSQIKLHMPDIVACGFNPALTFLFKTSKCFGNMYPTVCKVQKQLQGERIQKLFNLSMDTNIGLYSHVANRGAGTICTSFPQLFNGRTDVECFVPCDQLTAPFYQYMREVTPRIPHTPCHLLQYTAVPSLASAQEAMVINELQKGDLQPHVIMMSEVKLAPSKVKKCTSGGAKTQQEQDTIGANIKEDVPCALLTALYDNDEELANIVDSYGNHSTKKVAEPATDTQPARERKMKTDEVKSRASDVVLAILQEHQKRKAAVKPEMLEALEKEKPLLASAAAASPRA